VKYEFSTKAKLLTICTLTVVLLLSLLASSQPSAYSANPSCTNLQKSELTKLQLQAFQTKTFLAEAEKDYAEAKLKYDQNLLLGSQSGASKARTDMEAAQIRIDRFNRSLDTNDSKAEAILKKCKNQKKSTSSSAIKKCSKLENATLKTIVLQYQIQQDTKKLINAYINDAQVRIQNMPPGSRLAEAFADRSRFIEEYELALTAEAFLERQYNEVIEGCTNPGYRLPSQFIGDWSPGGTSSGTSSGTVKKSITCFKGKQTKKVIAVDPKCPKGYVESKYKYNSLDEDPVCFDVTIEGPNLSDGIREVSISTSPKLDRVVESLGFKPAFVTYEITLTKNGWCNPNIIKQLQDQGLGYSNFGFPTKIPIINWVVEMITPTPEVCFPMNGGGTEVEDNISAKFKIGVQILSPGTCWLNTNPFNFEPYDKTPLLLNGARRVWSIIVVD